jgi:multidrug efflux pump subunit AcrA (membrane-fusion protein)
LPLGSFVFVPAALRVVEVLVPLGERVGGGPVLRASSTRRVVTVALPTARQRSLSRGGAVLVTLPGGQRLPATVTDVGRVAVTPTGSPSGPGGPATISVTATLDDPAAAAGLDQAPVQVTITTTRRAGVLAVPVTALVAAPTGGYEVFAVDAGSRRPVTVRPGLFDELSGLIEVTGEGLAPGVRVEVPRR